MKTTDKNKLPPLPSFDGWKTVPQIFEEIEQWLVLVKAELERTIESVYGNNKTNN